MFAKIFIDRPKLAFVISIVISLLGALCIPSLPIAEYPEIAPPCIYVTAVYPGASSQVMVDTVASVIEEECNGLEHLLYYSSDSTNNGVYSLSVYFEPLTNSDIAQVNVQNAVQRAQSKLPKEVAAYGVTVSKRSSDMVGCYIFTTSDESKYSYLDMANYVRMNIKDVFARVPGVGSISLAGERNYSMRVWVDMQKLAGLGMEVDAVIAALQRENIQAAIGSFGDEEASDYVQLKLDAPGRRQTVEEFSDIVVTSTDDGRQVTLGDVAKVELAAEKYQTAAFWDGKPAIILQLYRLSGANAVDIIDTCNEKLKEMKTRFPADCMDGVLGYDPTEFIRECIKELVFTLFLTLGLVVFVTYFFLQDWRATIVPAVAIPVSLLGTFFAMAMIGFSINVLSMFGLILVIGLLVDDGVIVVENATRLIEQERISPYDAAVKSMKQTTGAILASTFVMVAIFAPLSFFGGIVGTIYKQFSVTMCVAIIFSAINALTLSPVLCAMLLRPYQENQKKNFIFKFFDWGINSTKNFYLRISKIFVRRSLVTCLVLAAFVFGNKWAFQQLSEGFIPTEDKGYLFCDFVLPPSATLKRSSDAVNLFDKMATDIPGVEHTITIAGASFTAGETEEVALGITMLKPWGERKAASEKADALAMDLASRCEEIPQGQSTVFQPPAIMGLGSTAGVSFNLCCKSATPKSLELAMRQLIEKLNDKSKCPDILFAFSSYTASTPQLYLDVDPQAAAAMNSSKGDVFGVLQNKIASAYVNDFNNQGYSFKVKVQADRSQRADLGNFDELTVRNRLGKQIPMSELAGVSYKLGVQRLTRFNQALAVPVTVAPVPSASTGDIMKQIEEIVKENLPKEYMVEWTDLSYHQRGNEGKLGILLFLSLAFGYLFLAAKYESWSVPLPVLLFILFATFGAMVALKICNMTLDVYAQLSLIMLLGLASKISILTVEFSKQERESGKSIEDAALNGADQRYRAIMMTAGCFIVGVIPLMVASGAGAASRNIVGVCTGWGMISATALGIGFLPPIYATIQRWREFVHKYFLDRNKKSLPKAE